MLPYLVFIVKIERSSVFVSKQYGVDSAKSETPLLIHRKIVTNHIITFNYFEIMLFIS